MNSSKTLDMTTGSLFKGIFIFSVPLVFTNLLQNLFQITDMAIVGRFAGSSALGAVGSNTQLLFFFTGFLLGIGGGINVLVAFYIGKKSQKDINETVSTAGAICLGFGIVLALLGLVFSEQVLVAMKTRPEFLDEAILYFRIYMISIPAVALYNFGNPILNAYGNTKLPLVFLAAAGVVNVILDLILVAWFKMGVMGVAIATVAAQYVSCFLTLRAICKGIGDYRFSFRNIQLSRQKAARLIKVGVPSGMQNCIFAFANVFVQSGVNSFSPAIVAGFSASSNGDNLIYVVLNSIYTACASFIGQNYGASNKKRILNSYFICLFYSVVTATVLGTLFLVFGRPFMGLFTNERSVVDAGIEIIKIRFYAFGVASLMDCTIASNRGLGKTFVPSIMVIIGSCVFRLVWIFTIFAHYRTLESLFLLYVFSWGITAAMLMVYFYFVYKNATRNL
ncbi:MAG: MATE family efflux transporter [Treponema sp.]|nr:MATE family efflux transporter [Candidatus Treponema equifaecale]